MSPRDRALIIVALLAAPALAAPPTRFDTYVTAARKLGFDGAEPWQIPGQRGWSGTEPRTGTELHLEMNPVDVLAQLHVTSFDLNGWQLTVDLVTAIDPETARLIPSLRPQVGRWVGATEYVLVLQDNRIDKPFRRLELTHLGPQAHHAELAAAHQAAVRLLLDWARAIATEESNLIHAHGTSFDDVPRDDLARSLTRLHFLFPPTTLYPQLAHTRVEPISPQADRLIAETATVCRYIAQRIERENLFGPLGLSPFDEMLLVIRQALDHDFYGPYTCLREHPATAALPEPLARQQTEFADQVDERLRGVRQRAAAHERVRIRQGVAAERQAAADAPPTASPAPPVATPAAPRAQPSDSGSTGGSVQVKGYYRKDGTYVRPHTRRAPSR